MVMITKRSLLRILICTILIAGFALLVRDLNGVRLLVVTPKILRSRPVIKENASTHLLDWKLITALIVQESGFKEHAVSSAGAKGLMQLMPETAKELGVNDPFEAEVSIAGATRYLRSLYDLYPESSHPNRIRIALASYNGGRGHIKDAQMIAKHQHNDPGQWYSVYTSLGLLTEMDKKLHAEVWESGVPPHGYFKGFKETRHYVKRVMKYYERLCYFSKIVVKVKSVLSI